MPVTLEEDAVDEILYLARANEAQELEEFLSNLAAQTNHPKPELVAAAVDPYSKNSALHYAAANGHIDVLKLLLEPVSQKTTAPASSPINAVNEAGNTPLHWAALNGHLECVKLLIQSGADITIFNKAGHDAVFEAEINDKGNVVEWLLSAVEELEKGIGGSGDMTFRAGQQDDVDMEESQNGQSNDAEVEDVRRQVEGMDTNEGMPKGG